MKTIQLTDKNALKIQRRELEQYLRQPGAESRYSNNKAEDSKRLEQIDHAIDTGDVPDPALESNPNYRRGSSTEDA